METLVATTQAMLRQVMVQVAAAVLVDLEVLVRAAMVEQVVMEDQIHMLVDDPSSMLVAVVVEYMQVALWVLVVLVVAVVLVMLELTVKVAVVLVDKALVLEQEVVMEF